MTSKAIRHDSRTLCEAAVLAILCFIGPTAYAQESRSASPARELVALMTQQHLDAFAATNPDAPNTFVAALLFPDVQLLVVSGQPTSPAYTQMQLNQRKFADVYATLHQAVESNSKIFFQDLKADGLHAKGDTVDIVYEQVVNQTIFDGAPSKHHLTDSQYAEKFAAADSRYGRLLEILIESLKASRRGS